MEKLVNPYYKDYHSDIAFKINEIIDDLNNIKKRLERLEDPNAVY